LDVQELHWYKIHGSRNLGEKRIEAIEAFLEILEALDQDDFVILRQTAYGGNRSDTHNANNWVAGTPESISLYQTSLHYFQFEPFTGSPTANQLARAGLLLKLASAIKNRGWRAAKVFIDGGGDLPTEGEVSLLQSPELLRLLSGPLCIVDSSKNDLVQLVDLISFMLRRFQDFVITSAGGGDKELNRFDYSLAERGIYQRFSDLVTVEQEIGFFSYDIDTDSRKIINVKGMFQDDSTSSAT